MCNVNDQMELFIFTLINFSVNNMISDRIERVEILSNFYWTDNYLLWKEISFVIYFFFHSVEGREECFDKNNVKYQLIDESAHDNTLYFSLELLEPRSLITVLLQFLPSRVLEERLISSGHAIAASAFGYNEWKNDYCKDRGVVKSVVDIFLFRRSISSSFDWGWERERDIYSSFNSSPIFRYSIIYIYIFY